MNMSCGKSLTPNFCGSQAAPHLLPLSAGTQGYKLFLPLSLTSSEVSSGHSPVTQATLTWIFLKMSFYSLC